VSSTCSTETTHGVHDDIDGIDEVFVRAPFDNGDCGSRIQNTNVVEGDF
jgi:hypothetical protein